MSARETTVVVHNQTSQDLHLSAHGLDHGEWTTSPPALIRAGATEWFKSESNGFMTGTEAWADYVIGGSPDKLNLHWVNPFAGLNEYRQKVSGPWGVYFSGGKGDRTTVEYFLIDDGVHAIPNYWPNVNGFHFPNHWPDIHITSIDIPGVGAFPVGNAGWGMCGGMAFASRDYYDFGTVAPTQTTNPTGEGDPLFDYIVRRLGASLNPADVADFLKFASPHYPDSDDVTADGRNWHMAHVAFPQIRNVIHSGHPCPIGVVTGSLPDLTHLGHQVLVHAYQLKNQMLTMWVYDPNRPDCNDVTLTMDISTTKGPLIHVAHNLGLTGNPPIRCFFTQGYDVRFPVGWIDGGGPGAHRATGDTMAPHTAILGGEQLTSANGYFHLRHEGDGNVTVSWDQGVLWQSGSGNHAGGTLIMQADGNLVLYGREGTAAWASGTNGHNGARLVMQNDGNAVIYAASGEAVWATNTVTDVPRPLHPGQQFDRIVDPVVGKRLSSLVGHATQSPTGVQSDSSPDGGGHWQPI